MKRPPPTEFAPASKWTLLHSHALPIARRASGDAILRRTAASRPRAARARKATTDFGRRRKSGARAQQLCRNLQKTWVRIPSLRTWLENRVSVEQAQTRWALSSNFDKRVKNGPKGREFRDQQPCMEKEPICLISLGEPSLSLRPSCASYNAVQWRYAERTNTSYEPCRKDGKIQGIFGLGWGARRLHAEASPRDRRKQALDEFTVPRIRSRGCLENFVGGAGRAFGASPGPKFAKKGGDTAS